jgi:ABC-type polysaccharide/polyol phosphate transport system ATPase subunit
VGTLKEYCRRCAVLDRGTLYIYDTVDEAAAAYEEKLAS